MLAISNLTYAYKKGQPILKNINLIINPGINLLIGENGSGKSTLLRLLSFDLLAPVPVLWNGEKLSPNELKKKLAYLPQEFNIYPSLKVRELLEFVAIAKGVDKSSIPIHVNDAAKKLNVTQYLGNKVNTCSVGTRRRVGIATALLGNPEIIILDEPTAGIDPKERVKFYEIIRNCFDGKTVIMATHILDDIDTIAENIYMISGGELTYSGSFPSFRHSLDNITYQIERNLSKEEICNLEKRGGCLLHTSKKDNRTISRFVSPNPPTFCIASRVEPTLEDIWEYCLRRHNHGEMGC